MSNYKRKEKAVLSRPIPIRFEQKTIDQVAEIHYNFAEFVRDAVDAWIDVNSLAKKDESND